VDAHGRDAGDGCEGRADAADAAAADGVEADGRVEGAAGKGAMTAFVTVFVLCYIAHKIGDYWVQTDWQAQNKARRADALWFHALTYTACFVPVFIGIDMAGVTTVPLSVLILLASVLLPHAWFDTRKPLNWYWTNVKRLSLDPASHPMFATLRLEMDQAFHYACLAGTAFLAAVVLR
jgi:hypothetical protein